MDQIVSLKEWTELFNKAFSLSKGSQFANEEYFYTLAAGSIWSLLECVRTWQTQYIGLAPWQ